MPISLARRRFVSIAAASLVATTPLAALAADDPAVARMQAFYDALLQSMKSAKTTPVKARYQKLEPAVRAAFDVAAMARIAIGPAWTTMSADDQNALLEQFARFTIATYASRFDGWSGERFEVDPTPEERGANKLVKTTLVKANNSGTVTLNYLFHPVADGWKATDVYLSGTISELATRRSEFGGILKSGGPKALEDSLRERTDKMLA